MNTKSTMDGGVLITGGATGIGKTKLLALVNRLSPSVAESILRRTIKD